MGRIVAVANQKGGVGKTTTASNLGAALAQLGCPVLVVDLDPQGNLTSGLGVDRRSVEHSVYEVLLDGLAAERAVLPTAVPGLWLLPSTLDVAGADLELAGTPERETRLRRSLAGQVDGYRFTLIDCPPSLGLLTINALAAAHSVLIPVQCEYYALEGLRQLMDLVQGVRARINPSLEVEGLLLTMFDGRTNLSIQVVDEVKRVFRGRVFSSIVPRNVRLSEAPSHGVPVALYDARSRGAQVYADLAREVVARGA